MILEQMSLMLCLAPSTLGMRLRFLTRIFIPEKNRRLAISTAPAGQAGFGVGSGNILSQQSENVRIHKSFSALLNKQPLARKRHDSQGGS
jgi:hypothetical protein